MASRKSKQKRGPKDVLASRSTAATAKKGFKRAPTELDELLRLANLEVPPDWDFLPHNLPENLSDLPPAIRLELFDHMQNPEAWHVPLEEMVGKIRARIREGKLPEPNRPDYSEKYLRQSFPRIEQGAHYGRIFQAKENLNRIVAVNERKLPIVRLIGEIMATTNPDGTGSMTYDEFTEILQSIDMEYIRRCKYEKCGKFFYAYRFQQPGCGPEHSEILRKQRKADRDKANKLLKLKGKTKRAQTARKR